MPANRRLGISGLGSGPAAEPTLWRQITRAAAEARMAKSAWLLKAAEEKLAREAKAKKENEAEHAA